jgi:hypothetical protein
MEDTKIIIYQTEDGSTKIETRLQDETVWLTQAQLRQLFQKSKSSISEPIKHIFIEYELQANSVVRNFRTTATFTKRKFLPTTRSMIRKIGNPDFSF